LSVHDAHETTKIIENEIREKLPYSDVFIHLEPLNDLDAHNDFHRDMNKRKLKAERLINDSMASDIKPTEPVIK
jgi:hypothetical protein